MDVESPLTDFAPPDVSSLLVLWRSGDRAALDKLVPFLYDELRLMARRYMNVERSALTLESAALVNEAYLRLVKLERVQWQDRAHVLAVSARMMRRILVEHARKRHAEKRGGLEHRVNLAEADIAAAACDVDLVELDMALRALAAFDERKALVIELRFFGGLSVAETAEALAVSQETVLRDWKLARGWLFGRLMGPPDAS